VAADSSVYGHDGNLIDNPEWQTDGCVSGSCLNFEGNSGYIEIPTATDLDQISAGVTIAAWVKPEKVEDCAAPVILSIMGKI